MISYNNIIKLSNEIIFVYLFCLLLTSIIFFDFISEPFTYIFGIVEVLSFFCLVPRLFFKYYFLQNEDFLKKVVHWTFLVRLLYIFAMYAFFYDLTGTEFEYRSIDSRWYYETANKYYSFSFIRIFNKLISNGVEVGDTGFIIYLCLLNKLFAFGGNGLIFIPRIFHAIFGTITVICIYKISRRHFGEITARLASLMCAFMPHLAYYCGLHLKEPVMIGVAMFALEQADFLICTKKVSLFRWFIVLLLVVVVFSFRSVLSIVILLSIFFAILLTSLEQKITLWKKIIMACLVMFFVFFLFGNRFIDELDFYVNSNLLENQHEIMNTRSKDNSLAKYVGITIFSPFIFTFPFPAVVSEPIVHISQRTLNGALFVKNAISIFCLILLFKLVRLGWRKHVILLFFLLGYLLVLLLSHAPHSERLHTVIEPIMLIFCAKGLVCINRINNLYKILWYCSLICMFVGWNYIKLKGRGLI